MVHFEDKGVGFEVEVEQAVDIGVLERHEDDCEQPRTGKHLDSYAGSHLKDTELTNGLEQQQAERQLESANKDPSIRDRLLLSRRIVPIVTSLLTLPFRATLNEDRSLRLGQGEDY